MSWILAFAGFAALIIFHEAGHFAAAKAVGMRVEKFYLFFPPKAIATQRGETEYGIGWIPLGGFVKITGMNPEEDIPPEVADRAYYAQPVWKRIVVIAAGPAVNLVIAFFIFYFLAFGAPQIDAHGVPVPRPVVGALEKGTPANGKLQVGDHLLAIDGVRGNVNQLRHQVTTHSCKGFDGKGKPTDGGDGKPKDGCIATTAATLLISRNGVEKKIKVKPAYDTASKRQIIGFAYENKPLDPNLIGAASFSADRMWDVTSKTLTIFSRIFQSKERKKLSSVVGSYEVTRQAIEFDPRTAIGLLGVISLSLAIINMFPFLPLDGGHIFWSIVEKIRRRPVSFRTMERSSIIGFALVLMLFAIGLTNDIGRLTGDGFGLR